MNSGPKQLSRVRLIQRAQRFLERRGSPRVQMSLIVMATGLAGFLASYSLLSLGLTRMWLRYGVAVGLAYAVFLFLVWLWVMYHRGLANTDIDPEALELLEFAGDGASVGQFASALPSHAPTSPLPDADASSGIGDVISFDADETVIVLVIIAAVGSALAAAIFVVATAPVLLGEVLVDGVLSAGLYHRLKKLEQRNWLESALIRTRFPIFFVLLCFVIAGIVMQFYAPEAASIVEVWQHIRAPKH